MLPTVVLGVVGSDANVVGVTILERALSTAGLDPVTSVGGSLAAGQDDPAATCERFETTGFDRAFGPDADAEAAVAALRRDPGVAATEPERVRADAEWRATTADRPATDAGRSATSGRRRRSSVGSTRRSGDAGVVAPPRRRERGRGLVATTRFMTETDELHGTPADRGRPSSR